MRIRMEFGNAGVYIWYPGQQRPVMHESTFAASSAQSSWRPPGLTLWQRIVCAACSSGPAILVSPSGKPTYWPPRWLLGDRDAD